MSHVLEIGPKLCCLWRRPQLFHTEANSESALNKQVTEIMQDNVRSGKLLLT